MSSERFENCCEDLAFLFKEVDKTINITIPKEAGEQRKNTIRKTQKKLDEVKYLLNDLDAELQQAPASYRNQMSSKARSLRREYEQYKYKLNDVTTSNSSMAAGREQLFGNSGDTAIERAELDYRAKLIQGNETLNRASESVARSQRVAAETDEVGINILTDLGDQRESLVRTRDTLTGTNQELGKSRRLISTIGRRVVTNKLLLGFIIILEVGILGLVIYLKFFKPKK
ncbi:Vesicle transport through interaction with t-SNAREs-like protein 1B [Trichoplax sp. H2]|nr:Vesicle transport through interaction with t-SNAREs-like protein 1B [Trichoplax sp. H2]|eukprot:RDD37752.1 Vesicle transport through interaction with t-SNAREs-like protein 1B [Trichoplax sp. H2]